MGFMGVNIGIVPSSWLLVLVRLRLVFQGDGFLIKRCSELRPDGKRPEGATNLEPEKGIELNFPKFVNPFEQTHLC